MLQAGAGAGGSGQRGSSPWGVPRFPGAASRAEPGSPEPRWTGSARDPRASPHPRGLRVARPCFTPPASTRYGQGPRHPQPPRSSGAAGPSPRTDGVPSAGAEGGGELAAPPPGSATYGRIASAPRTPGLPRDRPGAAGPAAIPSVRERGTHSSAGRGCCPGGGSRFPPGSLQQLPHPLPAPPRLSRGYCRRGEPAPGLRERGGRSGTARASVSPPHQPSSVPGAGREHNRSGTGPRPRLATSHRVTQCQHREPGAGPPPAAHPGPGPCHRVETGARGPSLGGGAPGRRPP